MNNFVLFLSIVTLIAGFVLLVKGSDYFVDGAAAIATKLGVSQLFIGLTIVAMGTSLPEAAVSIDAAINNSPSLSISNIIGSNIFNTLFILGAAAMFTALEVKQSTRIYEIPFMIVCSVSLLLLGYDRYISRVDGAILLILFVIYLGYLFFNAGKAPALIEDKSLLKTVPGNRIVYVLGGLTAVVLGSQMVVWGATKVAIYFSISQRMIGLTVVAAGTSLPELFTSISAARKGNAEIAVGNIVGSNIFNILFIVGVSSVIHEITFYPTFISDSCFLIFSAILLFIISYVRQQIRWLGGLGLLACFGFYYILLLT